MGDDIVQEERKTLDKLRQVERESAAQEHDAHPKSHLVVLVHGFMGSAADFNNFKEHLENDSDQASQFVVLPISKNSSTFDGVKNGATRAYNEVRATIEKNKSTLRRISLVGHSLGGIYARYLAFLLEKGGVFDRLEPSCFVTLATPHLGVRKPESNFINIIWNRLLLRFFQTTRELGLLDSTRDPMEPADSVAEVAPLLYIMATSETFLHPLRRFKRRALYSNVRNDLQVPYTTAAIRHKNPYTTKGNLPQPDRLSEEGNVPDNTKQKKCVMFLSTSQPKTASRELSKEHQNFTQWSLDNVDNRKTWTTAQYIEHGIIRGAQLLDKAATSLGVENHMPDQVSFERAFRRDSIGDKLRDMLFHLDVKVGDWERYDVVFNSFLAHEQIINKRKFLSGKSVVVHFDRHVLRSSGSSKRQKLDDGVSEI